MDNPSPPAESEKEERQKITVDALDNNQALVRVGNMAVKAFYGESSRAEAEKYAENLRAKR
jgi:hypothetical protein